MRRTLVTFGALLALAITAGAAPIEWGQLDPTATFRVEVNGTPFPATPQLVAGVTVWRVEAPDLEPGDCWRVVAIGAGGEAPSRTLCWISGPPYCRADLNDSGVLDLGDLAEFLPHLGAVCNAE